MFHLCDWVTQSPNGQLTTVQFFDPTNRLRAQSSFVQQSGEITAIVGQIAHLWHTNTCIKCHVILITAPPQQCFTQSAVNWLLLAHHTLCSSTQIFPCWFKVTFWEKNTLIFLYWYWWYNDPIQQWRCCSACVTRDHWKCQYEENNRCHSLAFWTVSFLPQQRPLL